jgi:beta-galactosidase
MKPSVKKTFFGLIVVLTHSISFAQTRIVQELKYDWYFKKDSSVNGALLNINQKDWQKITVPHDWAIYGPFDKNNDLQTVKILEDGETKTSQKTGRTGGLPHIGTAWYRKKLIFSPEDKNKKISVEFEGAMSNAQVYLNNKWIGEWPYGYSSFYFDITKNINWQGENILAVKLTNHPESARWYPGAGLYRKVNLIKTNNQHINHWGTFIQTKSINKNQAEILIATQTTNADGLELKTIIFNSSGKQVNEISTKINQTDKSSQNVTVNNPNLWSADNPNLYLAKSYIIDNGKIVDQYETTFGIREISFTPNTGMWVNGVNEKLKGVCIHHDLGPLGIAINKNALIHRLKMLKEMGCNAIRGTHNPHAVELLELCDQMGFYFIDEAFDEWKVPKVKNGYHLLFDKWAEKDLTAMILRDRNHPSVIMYSMGNEIREQENSNGGIVAQFLTDISHKLDPTRPTTAGFNNWDKAIKNGLANAVDIPGWNYKPKFYEKIHQDYPNWVIYGSETASTVSSRGIYKFPTVQGAMKTYADFQSTSYDLEYCSWSQLPDSEWLYQDKNDFVAGEFVWTGFDYLGEPTPYQGTWPSRSSYFGIIDLAGIPKDRYYLYQSKWSKNKMLHVLPHWNWEGKEGEIVPVYAYTNHQSAELFVNGKSYGIRKTNTENLLDRYRLRWENVVYSPGEIKVVAYDENNKIVETKYIITAAKASNIDLKADKNTLTADDEDLAYITISVTDMKGDLNPTSNNKLTINVTGEGELIGLCNGDAAGLQSFKGNIMDAFGGKCMAVVKSTKKAGEIEIKVSAEGLKNQVLKLKTK